MKYKTCVSIAEQTPAKTKKTLKIALAKSDFVEVRFDFLKVGQIGIQFLYNWTFILSS